MKKGLLFTILFTIACAPILFAQKYSDLDARIHEFTTLLLEPNESKLKDITSSKLTYGHSNSMIEDQTAFLNALVSGKSDYIKIEISDQKTEVIGKTAIVRQIMELDVKGNNTTNHLNLKVLLVWVKEKGKWTLVARQAVRISQ